MDTKIIAGIIGVIGLLLGWGGNIVLSQDQVDNSYVCNANGNVGLFQRLSDTTKSGYYIDETGVERQKICRDGNWLPLKQYAKDAGVVLNTLEQKVETVIEERLVRPECSGVAIVVKDGINTYYCNGLGPNVNCLNANDIKLPLYKT